MHTSKLLDMRVILKIRLSRPKPYGCRQCMMTAFTVLLLMEHRVYRWMGSDGVTWCLPQGRVSFLLARRTNRRRSETVNSINDDNNGL